MNFKKFVLAVFSSVFLFTIVSCGTETTRIALSTEGWEYSLTDPAEGNARFIPIPKGAGLHRLNEYIPGGTGFIYLQKNFLLPTELKNQDLSIFLGTVSMVDETRINGSYIGGEGRLPPNEFSAWNVTRVYTIPEALLNQSGMNTLSVKIWAHGEGAISGEPFIGVPEDAKLVGATNRFFNSGMYLSFAFFMLIIAGYHFIIYLKRPKEKENLSFSLVNLLTVFYLSVFYLDEIPGLPAPWMNFLVFQKIFSSGMPFLFPLMVTSFINDFQKRKEPKPVFYIRLGFALVPIVAMLFAPNYPALNHMKWLMVFIVPPMLYLLFQLFSGFRRHSTHTVLLLIGFSPLVLTAFLDIMLHVINNVPCPYFTAVGWLLADITLLLIMANRFATARTQAEYLNRNLGKKVEERTRKLTESYAKLESAKKRSDRDLMLAEMVQQSAYQRKLPRVEDWDIAFYFQPMAGISGDLYDFFISQGELKGVGLFEASGHGIATGLVTMLTKNIIERRFSSGINDTLPSVVSSINDDLVKVKGDAESYMSGVMLRVNGDRIEYVNAGHPKILKKDASTGNVEFIDMPYSTGTELINCVIGVEDIHPKFKPLTFNMHEGDAILLYSDALLNSRGTSGVDFGYDRIQKAFAGAGSGSAQDKLNQVLSIFNFYTKDVPLRDDLTIIVIQKK